MIYTDELRNRMTQPSDQLLLGMGIYSLRFEEEKAVYVGKAEQPIWFRLQDHYIRPRYKVDWFMRRATRIWAAVYPCIPTASTEGICILRAKRWCEKNGGKLLNETVPIPHNTDLTPFKFRYKPEGDIEAMEVQR